MSAKDFITRIDTAGFIRSDEFRWTQVYRRPMDILALPNDYPVQ